MTASRASGRVALPAPSTATPRSGLVLAGAATAVATLCLIGLGTWQVQRLAWKHALIATVTARASAPAIPAPGLDAALAHDPAALDYTVVRVTGRWLAGAEAHVQALLGEPRGAFGGPGQWVMTPLRRADGTIVWINRGFVPLDRLGRETPADPTRDVTIEGLARPPEPRGAFTPDDVPAKNEWFVRDPLRLSAAFGLPVDRTLPYTIDAGVGATPPSGLPQAGETRLSFSDNHLGYALTWYGLAIAAVGVFTARVRAERRRTGPTR
ncbi:SURF1 family protein [Pinisolibacter aquiterrae]|uniref:SURF1 family protein n=1 Tax=Pinisolibacter aquiterrae TaxID=2815579 RepID=UPI001C3D253F|nr:SURF1 family protein [Pinisolibacter aquiterrae]MCC8235002.1 SURF1 family protein [Pinisolibacter aquiterrae]